MYVIVHYAHRGRTGGDTGVGTFAGVGSLFCFRFVPCAGIVVAAILFWGYLGNRACDYCPHVFDLGGYCFAGSSHEDQAGEDEFERDLPAGETHCLVGDLHDDKRIYHDLILLSVCDLAQPSWGHRRGGIFSGRIYAGDAVCGIGLYGHVDGVLSPFVGGVRG